VSTEGGLRYLGFSLQNVDRQLLEMARELVTSGDVVWDVGANLGLFAFGAAARAGPSGKVCAIEPDTFLIGLLRRSAALEETRRAPVIPLPAAISDVVGVSRFYVDMRDRAMNHLGSLSGTGAEGARESQWVVTVTLDWLLEHLPAPNLVKVDVEGAEARVLRGAAKLLSTFRPRILCEVSEENATEVSSILHSFGYTLLDASERPSRRVPIEKAAWSTLAYPPAGS
jgi:FkbM family methyltransferase